MTDGNAADLSSVCEVQKGEQPWPLKVEPRANIADDSPARVGLVHVTDLFLKIVSLFCRRDSSIDDSLSSSLLWSRWRDVTEVVEAVSSRAESRIDFAR